MSTIVMFELVFSSDTHTNRITILVCVAVFISQATVISVNNANHHKVDNETKTEK